MKLFLGIILIVVDVVVASPEQCHQCIGNNCDYLYNATWNLTELANFTGCASSLYSLGTTHCGSATIRYKASFREYVESFRGCFNCSDEREACFALGGFLKALRGWTVMKCQIKCCSETNCNTDTNQSLTKAITVFKENAPGPGRCQACVETDGDLCTLAQHTEDCYLFRSSIGNTHCGSAKLKTRNLLTGAENVTFIRGCINCEDKKAACAILTGYVKVRQYSTVLECEIDCCRDANCNNRAANLKKCNYCLGKDANNCHSISNRRRGPQLCLIDPDALSTSHCGTAVGKYRNENGVVQDYFYRGCIDCADKKTTCFGLGGYLKGDVNNAGQTTVLQCDVSCCNSTYCNDHDLNLLPAAVTVFTPTVSGPVQCNVCLENDAASCSKNQQIQICATNPYSLGTTHCGSAVGRYRDSRKNIVYGFFRGCITCADKKAACAAIGGFRKNVQKWTQLECEIECCTGDNCNTQIPSLQGRSGGACLAGNNLMWSAALVFVSAFVYRF